MAILPGGTANLMSVELGIPKDLTKAVQGDGEIWGEAPLTANVLPGVLSILVLSA